MNTRRVTKTQCIFRIETSKKRNDLLVWAIYGGFSGIGYSPHGGLDIDALKDQAVDDLNWHRDLNIRYPRPLKMIEQREFTHGNGLERLQNRLESEV